jgi:hypothetical protein
LITELAASPGRGRNFELGCVSMWPRLASTARYKFKMLETSPSVFLREIELSRLKERIPGS